MADAKDAKIVPIESLMDASIDDIKDVPGFDVPPNGRYKLGMKLEVKKINEHPAIECALVVRSTVELSNKEEKAPDTGAKFSTLFMMDNEFGQGFFKEFAKSLAAGLSMGNPKVSDILARCAQIVEIEATVTRQPDKKNPEKVYGRISNVAVA